MTDIAPDVNHLPHQGISSQHRALHISDGLKHCIHRDFNCRAGSSRGIVLPGRSPLHGSTYGGANDIQPQRKEAEEKLYEMI